VSLEVETGSQIAASQRRTLEQCAVGIEHFLQRYKLAVLLILSFVYFGGSVLRARSKPFWFDELLTVLASGQPTYSATIRAARDLDWTPPFTDVVGHFVNQLAGSGEVVFRLPAMIGFWIFCLCLFGFAARRVNIFFALSALLLPFVTSGAPYSVEARSYGMMLGFCGIALISWQAAAAEKKRALALAGLLFGIGGAVLCHYYAVLIYLPLAGGEAFRSWRTRRIDKAIWAAFLLGVTPLVVSLAGVVRVTSTNPHPQTVAGRQHFFWYYLTTFETALWFLIPVTMLCAIWLVLGGSDEEPEGAVRGAIPDYELAAAILMFLIPLAAITLAMLVPPHIFTDRYALPSIGGFALITALLGGRCAGRRSTLGVAFALPALACFALSMAHGRAPLQNPFEREPLLVAALKNDIVAVRNPVSYLQLWYYAPPEMKSRLLYITDENSSVKYLHVDEGMLPFRKFGAPVVSYDDFAAPGKEFLVYSTPDPGWLPEKILDEGGSVRVVALSEGKALLRVRLK
jgi:hypothetical protein